MVRYIRGDRIMAAKVCFLLRKDRIMYPLWHQASGGIGIMNYNATCIIVSEQNGQFPSPG